MCTKSNLFMNHSSRSHLTHRLGAFYNNSFNIIFFFHSRVDFRIQFILVFFFPMPNVTSFNNAIWRIFCVLLLLLRCFWFPRSQNFVMHFERLWRTNQFIMKRLLVATASVSKGSFVNSDLSHDSQLTHNIFWFQCFSGRSAAIWRQTRKTPAALAGARKSPMTWWWCLRIRVSRRPTATTTISRAYRHAQFR